MMQGVLALTPADPPEPSYANSSEAINVDGNSVSDSYGEWNSDDDFFADMYKAGNPEHKKTEVLSKLYLRYDCIDGYLYAMVLLEPGCVIDENSDSEEHYIKVDGDVKVDESDDDDGIAPDFHYILNDNNYKIGWEASTYLPPGSYKLNVHTQVDDDDTSAVAYREIPLEIYCDGTDIPEFPTVALPIAAILGLMFIFGRKRDL